MKGRNDPNYLCNIRTSFLFATYLSQTAELTTASNDPLRQGQSEPRQQPVQDSHRTVC